MANIMGANVIGAQIYATESPYEIRSLHDRLLKHRQELINAMPCASDWADFKYRNGEIHGINEALAMLDDLTREKD